MPPLALLTQAAGAMVGVGLGTFVGMMEGAHGELKGDTFRQQARPSDAWPWALRRASRARPQLSFGFRRSIRQSWTRSKGIAGVRRR